MSPALILGLIVGAPLVVLMLLRVNAALVFLSLCLGSVLVQYVGGNTAPIMSLLQSTHIVQPLSVSQQTVRLTLLLAPPALTAFFMIRTVRGRGKLLLNALPAAGVGLLGALLVVPLLSAQLSITITTSSLWAQLQHAQNIVVGGSALLCLLALWAQRPKSGGGEHESKSGRKGKHKKA